MYFGCCASGLVYPLTGRATSAFEKNSPQRHLWTFDSKALKGFPNWFFCTSSRQYSWGRNVSALLVRIRSVYEYLCRAPKPKHTHKYTKAKVQYCIPKINTHSCSALPVSAAAIYKCLADTTPQRLLTHTHLTTDWLPVPLPTQLDSGPPGHKLEQCSSSPDSGV